MGSTDALSDMAQNTLDRYVYTAYGGLTLAGGSTNPFRYVGGSGYYFDRDTSWYSMRMRTYRPAVARWISPDRYRFIDGSNLYRYVQNRPIVRIDPSGAITVIALDDELNVSCGETAYIEWDFLLDTPAPCEGYMVQRVDVYCKIDFECADCLNLRAPAKPDITYYEAWEVAKGDDRWTHRKGGLRARFLYTDKMHLTHTANACGVTNFYATVKFYCKNGADDPNGMNVGTGDIGGLDKPSADRVWGPGRKYRGGNCESKAGRITSTGTEPPWWSKDPVPTEYEGFHYLFGVWNCCKCKKNFTRTSGGPKLESS